MLVLIMLLYNINKSAHEHRSELSPAGACSGSQYCQRTILFLVIAVSTRFVSSKRTTILNVVPLVTFFVYKCIKTSFTLLRFKTEPNKSYKACFVPSTTQLERLSRECKGMQITFLCRFPAIS